MKCWPSGVLGRTSILAGVCAAGMSLWSAPAGAASGPLPMLLTPAPVAIDSAKQAAKAQHIEPTVSRQRAVRVALELLDGTSPTAPARLAVQLFDNRVVVLQRESLEQRSAGNYTWSGFVVGYPESHALLSVVDGEVSGSIETLDPAARHVQSYQIDSSNGAASLKQVNRDAFPSDHPPEAESRYRARAMIKSGPADETHAKATAAADSGDTIDVMVVYSNQTAAVAGSGIGAQIQQAIDVANTAYANSGITTRLRLVHYEPAQYDESGDFNTDLNRLTGTSDGYMDNVHALRTTYGADLVSLFVENAAYCGLGWVGPSASYAFTVVNRGCAAGNYSLAHELGHNFGALHDPYVDPSTSPYAYGHGFVNATAGWRTVMAYNNACAAAGTSCTRIPYFSNSVLTYGGTPLGTSTVSDVARVINQNAYTVANFRASGGSTTTTTCSYNLSQTNITTSASASSGSDGLSTATGCSWTATSSASWLSVGPGNGSGAAALSWSATANSGAQRSANITVGGQTIVVTQQAAATTTTTTPTSAAMSLAAKALDFGNQRVGTTSAAKSTSLINTGTVALTINSITAGGANPGDFVASGSCAAKLVLNPGQSCTLQYSFAPTTSGNRGASIAVSTTSGNSTLALSRKGTGK